MIDAIISKLNSMSRGEAIAYLMSRPDFDEAETSTWVDPDYDRRFVIAGQVLEYDESSRRWVDAGPYVRVASVAVTVTWDDGTTTVIDCPSNQRPGQPRPSPTPAVLVENVLAALPSFLAELAWTFDAPHHRFRCGPSGTVVLQRSTADSDWSDVDTMTYEPGPGDHEACLRKLAEKHGLVRSAIHMSFDHAKF